MERCDNDFIVDKEKRSRKSRGETNRCKGEPYERPLPRQQSTGKKPKLENGKKRNSKETSDNKAEILSEIKDTKTNKNNKSNNKSQAKNKTKEEKHDNNLKEEETEDKNKNCNIDLNNVMEEDLMKEYIESSKHLVKIYSIILANKLNLFGILELDEFLSIEKIQELLKIKIHIKQLTAILDKLAAEKIIEKQTKNENLKYRNTDKANKYLSSKSEYNFLPIYYEIERNIKNLSLYNFEITKNYFDESDEIQNLKNVNHYCQTNQHTMNKLVDYFNFGRYNSVIDVKGRNGDLACKIKKAFPFLEVNTADGANIRGLTEKHLLKLNCNNSIKIHDLNLMKDKINNYDVIIAPYVLQYFNEQNKRTLLNKLFDALNDNGILIIIEDLITDNLETFATNVNFLIAAQGEEGYCLSLEEYQNYLSELGFMNIDHRKFENTSDFIFARKKT